MLEHRTNPVGTELLERLALAQHEVFLVAPYISDSILRECLSATPPSVQTRVITALRLDSYLSGALELRALRSALDTPDTSAYSVARLHAKAVVVDEHYCFVGSNNLTHGGWYRNAELGLALDQRAVIDGVKQSLNAWLNSESSFRIEPPMLDELLSIPRPKRAQAASELPETTVPVGQEDMDAVVRHLGGWRGATLEVIRTQLHTEFALADIYQFEPHFQQLFPRNDNIQAKLRQQLQALRDLGLVAFLGGGRYQKLF